MLKAEFLELNRDLSLLEEEVLYPADQQLLVFVSMTNSTQTTPRSVRIELDGNLLVDHDYARSEVEALKRGGVQRLYIGKVEAGDHVLKASLVGTAGKSRNFQRKATTEFSRWRGPTYVELRIEGTGSTEGPEFRVDLW